MGNPGELARTLTGRPVRVIDRNGAPSGEKHVVVLDPPIRDARTGARPGPSGLAQRSALAFLRAGRQTIVFGRSRVQVELMLTSLREQLREGRGPLDRVRGYRGGYLPSERRAIEAGLRSGDILGVVSTTALELGIDIGRLDVAVIAGTRGPSRAPGSRSAGPVVDRMSASRSWSPAPAPSTATWRAIRTTCSRPPPRRRVSTLRTSTSCSPISGRPPSSCRSTPESASAPADADDLLAFLAEEGHVRQADDERWYWASENFPASEVSLRVAAPENVLIIDTGPERPRVIGEVDLFSAPTLVHEDAIYLHESRQYHVDRLDWEERKAYVRPVDVDHYTQAELAVTLKPLEVFAEAALGDATRAHGEVMVSRSPPSTRS